MIPPPQLSDSLSPPPQSLRESIQHDNLLLAAGSLVVSWCNCVPCMLGILLSLKLKHRPRASQADESHLRVCSPSLSECCSCIYVYAWMECVACAAVCYGTRPWC